MGMLLARHHAARSAPPPEPHKPESAPDPRDVALAEMTALAVDARERAAKAEAELDARTAAIEPATDAPAAPTSDERPAKGAKK